MADAMVTARMSQDKKARGNRVLDQLGMNASQAINWLYDYVIEHKKMPAESVGEEEPLEARLANAAAWFDEMAAIGPAVDSRFLDMADDQIRRERLASRGLLTEDRAL